MLHLSHGKLCDVAYSAFKAGARDVPIQKTWPMLVVPMQIPQNVLKPMLIPRDVPMTVPIHIP